jgi:hypothetical protein
MHLITTNRSTYAISPLGSVGKMWKFNEGSRVWIRGYPEGCVAVVVRRVAGNVFPHYEVMDDDGTMLITPQLNLVRVRP